MYDYLRYSMWWMQSPTTSEPDFGAGLSYRVANNRMHYKTPEHSRLHYRVHNTRMHYQTHEVSR